MAANRELEVTTETIDGATVLRPKGEIDLSCAPDFRQYIADAVNTRPQRLIVDLTDVPYMDSSGVATLVEGMQLSQRAGARLVLAGMQQRVLSIFEIARLDSVFTITDDLDAALGA